MKTFRLSSAELKKIWLRPVVFLMALILVIFITICSMFYDPSVRQEARVNFTGMTVGEVFSKFNSTTSTDSNTKSHLDAYLDGVVDSINDFLAQEDGLQIFKDDLEAINYYRTQTLNSSIQQLANDPSASNIASTRTCIGEYKALIEDANTCFLGLDANINFYITTKNFETVKKYLSTVLDNLPSATALASASKDQLIAYGNTMLQSFSFDTVFTITNAIKKMEITTEEVDALFETYYDDYKYIENSSTKLTHLYETMTSFVSSLSGEDASSSENISKLNQYFSNYKSIVTMASTILENKFLLLKTNGISDGRINSYVGFTNYNAYYISEQNVKIDYLLINDLYDVNFLNNFNFLTTSGFETSAYDFCVYTMQIVSIILTVFCMFFAIMLTAGEHADGTIKMLAMRPYSRNKIMAGKFLAVLRFMTSMVLFCGMICLIIGIFLYGMPVGNVLLVFNATNVIILNPLVVYLIYLAGLLLNIGLFVAIAMLFAMWTRSSAVGVLFSLLCLIISVVFNGIFAMTSWFRFVPFAHLDLFKYFGGANFSSSFLSFNILADADLFVSLGIYFCILIAIRLITQLIFKYRNIA